MEIDTSQVTKIFLLSVLANKKNGRTLKDAEDLVVRSGIIVDGFIGCIDNKSDVQCLFEQFKDQGLIYIRENEPLTRYVLSENGEFFLLDNVFAEFVRNTISLLIEAKQGECR